jgi:Kef-type K+ transport system membrane component KefB
MVRAGRGCGSELAESRPDVWVSAMPGLLRERTDGLLRERTDGRLRVLASLGLGTALALCLACLVHAPLAAVLQPRPSGSTSALDARDKISLTSARGVAMVRDSQARKESNLERAGVGHGEALGAIDASRLVARGRRQDLSAVVRQVDLDGKEGESATLDLGIEAAAHDLAPLLPGAVAMPPPPPPPPHPMDHPPSRLFEHFDADSDGQLSEKEVAALLKQLTRKRKDEEAAAAAAAEAAGQNRAAGMHDVSIDGETLSVGDGDFDLLFKQLSNLKQTKDPSKDPRMTLQEDIVFIKDLVIVFFAATVGGVLATHFGQPALIGFLLGGMTVGPGGFGAVTELVEVETLASLGIAFLLFSLGIEFSITELQDVRRVVLVGGVISMFSIVVGTGVLSLLLNLVKTAPEAIALGLAVSLSSTAVVLQCLPSETAPPSSPVDPPSNTRPAVRAPAHSSQGSAVRSKSKTNHHRQVNPASTGSPGTALLGGPDSCGSVAVGVAAGRSSCVSGSPDVTMLSAAATRTREESSAHSLSNLEDWKPVGGGGVVDGGGSGCGLGAVVAFDAPRSRKVMLGLLVFQDVMIGLILAMLPTLQGSLGQFFEELMSALLRLGCFVMVSLILSEFALPTLADRVDKARSQEVFTMGCVVFCLAMAYLSERMGLAIELGAFTAGIMLSESRHKARVEESVEGIRTVFSAVFFISVGMMIHWRYFYQNFVKMLVLLFVILLSKGIVFAVVIFALGGLPVRTAIACGAAIAQAGEFTFVIASKGQALLLFSASEARMINGATALSMLASPYIIRYARRWSQRGLRREGSAAGGSLDGPPLSSYS